jgi:hypothetical protein
MLEIMLGAKEKAGSELEKDFADGLKEWKKEQEKLSPLPDALAARLVGAWHADRLGALTVKRVTKSPGYLRFDAGEWSSKVGYRKLDHDTEQLVFLDAPLAGLPLRIESSEMVIVFGQDTFRFARR